jgi:hypothetical protein
MWQEIGVLREHFVYCPKCGLRTFGFGSWVNPSNHLLDFEAGQKRAEDSWNREPAPNLNNSPRETGEAGR